MKRNASQHDQPPAGRCAAILCAAALIAGSSFAAAASAADDESDQAAIDALTKPISSIEFGVGGVTAPSYKFGEYNGLEKSGTYGVGGFDIYGGGNYDSSDPTRWRLRGTDLGLDTRKLSGEYGEQGLFRVNLGFDEIPHNITDSYYSPYIGVGSSVLSLPATWVVPVVPRVSASSPNARGLSGAVAGSSALVAGVLTAPTVAQLATSQALIGADLPSFLRDDLSTTRKRYDAGVSYLATPKWEITVNGRHEERTGAKPMGSITATTGGDISTVLADPIDQTTDQIAVALGYHDRHEFLQFAYNGSFFKNRVDSLTWTNWAQPATTMTMSSAPSNQSHQLALSGRYDFSATTRVVGSAAYTRNTQNDSFLTSASTPLVPVASLNGLVVMEAFNLKLTSRPRNDLNLGLSYKFDKHDNQTPVNIYAYYDANTAPGANPINTAFSGALGVPAALLSSNVNVNENRPYSRRLDQVNGDATFNMTPTELLRAGYEFQRIKRWCSGTWIDCMDADVTTENSANLELRSNPKSNFNTSLSYLYSKRDVGSWNPNAFLALVPMAGVSPTGATGGLSAYAYMLANGLTGYGPVAGYGATTGNANLFFPLNNALANTAYQNQNRISEILGLLRYNSAPRNRNRVRGNADWQATDKLDVQGNVDYRIDDYNQSVYGLLSDRDLAATLDASYSPTENVSMSIFYTYEDQHSQSAGNSYTANSAAAAVNGATAISGGCFATIALRNASNKIDPCLNWQTDMHNKTNVVGLNLDRKNLAHGKLDLGAQFTFSRSSDSNDVQGGNYANNPLAVAGAPAGTVAAYFIAASPLPSVIDDVFQIRLNARYDLSKNSALGLTYLFADMYSSDYAYQGLQLGGLSGVLPSLQTSPSYVVHVIVLSYSARF